MPDLTPRLRYCDLFPEECAPDRPPRDLFAPVPERPERGLPPLTEMVWGPIDRSLERGLRRMGITGEWNQRLRDAARGGAERGATALLDQTMDAANLTGETREAVSAALRARRPAADTLPMRPTGRPRHPRRVPQRYPACCGGQRPSVSETGPMIPG